MCFTLIVLVLLAEPLPKCSVAHLCLVHTGFGSTDIDDWMLKKRGFFDVPIAQVVYGCWESRRKGSQNPGCEALDAKSVYL